jgi:Sec-independent protein secretion pathway component TatC
MLAVLICLLYEAGIIIANAISHATPEEKSTALVKLDSGAVTKPDSSDP